VYTLDTNAIIYYIKGDKKTISILEPILSGEQPLYVSVITEAELFSYSHLREEETLQIDTLLRTTSIMLLDSRLARLAGMIRRTYNIKLYDSIIAATALITGSTLLTRNTKDFKKISSLSLQAI
jgi:predicted nucleic acid-binding protein